MRLRDMPGPPVVWGSGDSLWIWGPFSSLVASVQAPFLTELSVLVHGSLSGEKYVCNAPIRLLSTNENPSFSWTTWLTLADGSKPLAEVVR